MPRRERGGRIARGAKRDRLVDRLGGDGRGDRVVEVEVRLAEERREAPGELRRRERPGRDDRHAVRELGELLAPETNARLGLDASGELSGETLPVDGQGSPCRHLMRRGSSHDERARPPHLRMQEPDRIQCRIVAAKGIGADEFGQERGLVSIRLPLGPHLMDDRRHAGHGHLPGGFRPRKAAPDDMDRMIVHGTGC